MSNSIINELYTCLKNDIPYRLIGADYDLRNRLERATVVDILSNYYTMDERSLKRLSDFLVNEELTDSHPDKMSREEYPFMSDTQLSRRVAGIHRKRDGKGILEVQIGLAENYGTDGRNYNRPLRRKRTFKENMYVDEQVLSRNKERRKKYSSFINGKTNGVYTVDLETGDKTVHDDKKYEEIYQK
ncbi:Uncharacterized protein BC88300_02631 [Bacillus cytotoxicus]|nr:Uncharacterized protein BC88300_02631 [Bacillus cytotoxicus]